MALQEVEAGTASTSAAPSTARRVGLAGLALVVLVVACAATAQRVSRNAEARAEAAHHSALGAAAGVSLNAALEALVKVPVSDRVAGVLPGAPTLGDAEAVGGGVIPDGGDRVQTTLLVSTPDTVAAKVEITSDGYSTTLVEKYTSSPTAGQSSDVCSFGDLGSATNCDSLLS
jgi:hypothetical protein